MKVQCQSSDRISALPEDAIEKILSLMPIRDALKTSILSKRWRHCWTRMPKLVLDEKMVKRSSSRSEEIVKYKLVNAIFHVLLLHNKDPIPELCICIADTEIANEFDQIILHLSWTKNIKKFIFEISSFYYKLPSSFFSIQGLEHIELAYCAFELPSMCNGFSMLKSLIFEDVSITANMLQRLLTSCPLLEELTLIGYHRIRTNFTGGDKCTFVELFRCLPYVQFVNISWTYIEPLAAGGLSQKLPTSLVYLRTLVLHVCFHKQDEVCSTLCVINSSPNLEKIKVKMVRQVGETCSTLLDPHDYSDLKLDHLKEVEITSFHNYAPEMEFVKLIMAKSPLIKKARIELDCIVSLNEEVMMLRDLLQLPFQRSSPAAKFIIERPKKLHVNAY